MIRSGWAAGAFSLGLSAASLMPNLAEADTRRQYALVHLYSAHVGDDDVFNDNTPGLAFGVNHRFAPAPAWEWGLEVGTLWNSYEELSPYGAVTASRHVAEWAGWELRAGAGLALAYYDELTTVYEELYDIHLPGSYAPLLTSGAILRHRGGFGLRATVLPQSEVDLVASFAAMWRY